MRLMTILGTRPEIIRLSRIIPLLDCYADHTLVHTGQNHDANLSDIFFSGLAVRQPDIHFGISAPTFAEQVGRIMMESERVLRQVRPDRLVVLGDTNSALAAVVACRLGIPVFHLEAGNRCYDDRVPEEVNRRVIDHTSTVLMPYTERSRANLLREGIESDRVHVIGNPILEVLEANEATIRASKVHERLGVRPDGFVLVTAHRQENVDDPERLALILASLESVHAEIALPLVWPVHPRARHRMEMLGVPPPAGLLMTDPLGFGEFVALERTARCVLSDSGTVQEECCILRVPNVTIRDVTERPETIECGSNILSGIEPEAVVRAVRLVLSSPPSWTPPKEYLATNVSDVVLRIVVGSELPRGRRFD